MDDDEAHGGEVNDLLEQCVDHAALRLSTGPSDALDADLIARLQRLKASPAAAPSVESDSLQSDLAERFAALKKNPSKPHAPEIVETSKLSGPHRIAHEMHEGDAVEKLLESVQDSVRLERSSMPECIHDWVRLEKSDASRFDRDNESDEEVSESEVDHILEWVKDAAALEEDDASDVELPTTPPAAHPPQGKKKASRWKFW